MQTVSHEFELKLDLFLLLGVSANIAVNLDKPLLEDSLDLLGGEGVLQTVPEHINTINIQSGLRALDQLRCVKSCRQVCRPRHTALLQGSSVINIIVPLKKEKLFQMSL